MILLVEARSSRVEGHLSGGQSTRDPPVAAAGADRRAGSVADPVLGDRGGDRAGRPPGDDQAVGCGDRADQDPGSRVHRRAAAGRDGVRAAGRGGVPGRAGPLTAPMWPGRCSPRWPGWARRPRPGWPASSPTGSGGGGDRAGDIAAAALDTLTAVAPQRAAQLSETVTIDVDTTDVEVYGRQKSGVASTTRANGSGSARGDLGRDRRRAGRGPDERARRSRPPRRSCCAARWPRCPPQRGPGGLRAAGSADGCVARTPPIRIRRGPRPPLLRGRIVAASEKDRCSIRPR